MQPKYFIAILFATSLYWMYLLYAPFLLMITIASLLAISTSSIQNYFEALFQSRFFAAASSSILLALLFFAPLGYFLTTFTMNLNSLEPEAVKKVFLYVKKFIEHPPEYLDFVKPYMSDIIEELNINALTSNALSLTAKVGAFSAGFLKNAFLVVVFYFFAQYNGTTIMSYIKRVIQLSVDEVSYLIHELSSVMSVVFFSILANAMFQGFLFGVAVSFMGYNGLLYGIMYGFTSLIPLVGGALLWLPFMIYEFSIGDSSSAIFIVLYSVLVISITADTFIKPLIIKEINRRLLKESDTKLDELVIFFSIIAGLSTFGFWGMILGPAITAFFLTVLKLFEARTQEFNI